MYSMIATIGLAVNLHCTACDCLGFSRAKMDALQSLALDAPPKILILRDGRCPTCAQHALVHVRLGGVTYYLDNGTIGRNILTRLPPWWTVVNVLYGGGEQALKPL